MLAVKDTVTEIRMPLMGSSVGRIRLRDEFEIEDVETETC